ncbi:hypothetical protein HBNXHr_0482 [Halorhabdus sp. BNX81]|nr:hypothetical protein HBNXHr_0482 [Halorhabdus sp. BNX81]
MGVRHSCGVARRDSGLDQSGIPPNVPGVETSNKLEEIIAVIIIESMTFYDRTAELDALETAFASPW